MAATLETSCPACAMPLSGRHGGRWSCPGCGRALLLVSFDHDERGALPAIDAAGARAAFARLYERDGEPEPGPSPTGVQLYLVPFYELAGTMAGVTASGRVVHRSAAAYLPGIEDRDDIGLDSIDPARGDEAETVRPPSDVTAALGRLGIVLAPEGEREEVEAILAEQIRIPADGDEALLLDRCFGVAYYPVWRLVVTVRGETYQATVDGVTGMVLRARVPAKQRRRIFNGVCAAACLGYVLGTMLRHPGMGVPGLGRAIAGAAWLPLVATLALAALGAALYVLLVNAAWNSLRYRNELVYHSGLKTRVLVNRSAETALDRGTAAMRALWVRVFGPRRFDR